MEINKLLNGIGTYDKTKLEKAENDKAKAKRDAVSTENKGGGDKVNFSDEAMLRTEALTTAQNTDDVRREKIEALKAQVQSGTYQMDNKKIAGNIIRDDLDLLA